MNSDAMTTDTPETPIRTGVVIRERHKHAAERRITSVAEGQYVMAIGIASGRTSRIGWASLRRYDIVTGPTYDIVERIR